MVRSLEGYTIYEGFRCKTHYIHLVHSEKFHVLRTTLNAFCHKSDNSALHSAADNAFCATTLSVELSTTWQHNTGRNSIFTFWLITRFASKPLIYPNVSVI